MARPLLRRPQQQWLGCKWKECRNKATLHAGRLDRGARKKKRDEKVQGGAGGMACGPLKHGMCTPLLFSAWGGRSFQLCKEGECCQRLRSRMA